MSKIRLEYLRPDKPLCNPVKLYVDGVYKKVHYLEFTGMNEEFKWQGEEKLEHGTLCWCEFDGEVTYEEEERVGTIILYKAIIKFR